MKQLSHHIKIVYAAALIMGCCFVYGCENDVKVINELTDKKVMKEEAIKIEA